MSEPMTPEHDAASVYLGDAVYASFDGYHIWLRTGDGNDQAIALEPEVLAALDLYRTRLARTYSADQYAPRERT